MPKQKNINIDYTSRDFNTIKEDLIDYAKRYYPDSYKDFTDASFGSMVLDTVSYVGDILSYYLDYSVNESFLDTAIEFNNVRKWDFTKTEHSQHDDHSQAFLPHMDKENGTLISLNIEAIKWVLK